MKCIALERTPRGDYFVATSYTVPRKFSPSEDVHPRICTGTTSRIFKLERGCQRTRAVFTKNVPMSKECRKWYKLEKINNPQFYYPRYGLKGFRSELLSSTRTVISEMYEQGYRYVRVEKTS